MTAMGQTVSMRLRRAVEADRRTLAVLAADLQARPDRHVTYLGEDARTIAAEMVAEDDDWTEVSAVAELDDGADTTVVGWLMGSVDADMGRVWWFGPFVDDTAAPWEEVADRLYDFAAGRMPRSLVEEELAPDARFTRLIDWACDRGFDVDPGSAVVTLVGGVTEPSTVDPAISIRPLAPGDAAAVERLHDELFAGTHTTGASIASEAGDGDVRLVAEIGGRFAGYIAAEHQPDGGGYIDYLGTATEFRRRGVAAGLVRAAVGLLRDQGAGDIHLTVREASDGARALYAGLGFVEERVIVPLRRGFRLR